MGWTLVSESHGMRTHCAAPEGVTGIGRWYRWDSYESTEHGAADFVRYEERDLREWWHTDFSPCGCGRSCCWGQSIEHNRFTCTHG